MTTEQRAPTAFARAEATSRQLVMQVGLGVVAFVLGSIMSAGASARVMERLGPIESDLGSWLVHVVFERLWLFVAVPLFGYVAGRFTQIPATRFTLTSVLSGETFSVLLVTGINGFEYLTADWTLVAARLVTLFLGMLVTHRAVLSGRADAADAQAAADVIAAQRKAEYAEYLAAAEGKKPADPGGTTPGAGPTA